MTAKVVDASAFAAVIFLEPTSADVEQMLRDYDYVAPTLLRYEIANVCAKKIRARPDERDLILGQYKASLNILIREHEIDPLQAVHLALQLGLSTYDASYLWLSRELECELVTLDNNLRKAAAKSEG